MQTGRQTHNQRGHRTYFTFFVVWFGLVDANECPDSQSKRNEPEAGSIEVAASTKNVGNRTTYDAAMKILG